jgi:CDP-6-deoxy-D-xylo-4-hexulose-3-dehydrase
MIKQLDWPLMQNSINANQKQAMIEFIKETDRFTNGEKVRDFEEQWAAWEGTNYALFVNSGGSANLLLLDAVADAYFRNKDRTWKAGRPPRVLVPACTWGTTIAPLIQVGYDIEYCDIDLETYSFDEKDMERIKREDNTPIDIVWITHLLGSPSNINRIRSIFYNAMILEDCCESHGATFEGQKVGTFGEGSTFSFYFGHHLTAVEGGMVCTNNEGLYDLMRMKRSHGLAREATPNSFNKIKKEYPHLDERFLFPTVGYNLRNVEINAIVGMMQLKHLNHWIKLRKRNLQYFNKILSQYGDEFYKVKEAGNSSFALAFICKDKDRKKQLENHLTKQGVETRPFLVGNITRQPFINHPHPESFKNAEFLHNHAFYVGNNQFITETLLQKLSENIAEIYGPIG